ncbi:MAG: acyl-CoA thioester hydrolase [Paraglaciecola sp.]|jgi:acyl-CoA thioester hydrolase
MKKKLTYKGAVMTWECDSNHHMNVMYYVNKFEHAGRAFGLEMGLTELGRGKEDTGIVVVEQTIKYLREVFEDDLLYVESSLVNIGNKAFTILHEMYNAETKDLVSTMEAVLVLFDKKSRKALSFPKEKKEALLMP